VQRRSPGRKGIRIRRSRWGWASIAVVFVAGATACGGDDGATPTLTWWINPDPNPPAGFQGAFGQAGIAERCSTDEYRIETELLPGSASEQRIQLARRLAADDSSIDLMSLDPPFTAEFAAAGFLEPLPSELQQRLSAGVLQGAIDGASWEGQLVVAPLWANTQVLWFRKSLADAGGLDMTQPVTWDQIIEAAASAGGTVGVQANKYEGYIVWINALVMGAGGELITGEGEEAEVAIASEAGTEAARVVATLAASPAAQADLSVSNEGTVLGPFGADPGAFMVNWTFVYNNFRDGPVLDDIGWARYPQTIEGQESRPPIGGINVGVGAFSGHPEEALAALECITSQEQQIIYAVDTANMPARADAYEDPGLTEQFPADLLTLFRESIDAAGPRPASPFWSTIVNAMLAEWHPADSVDPESTPESSSDFVADVLDGEALT
jgi:trehalose/maltose transport system substrate-binding protein